MIRLAAVALAAITTSASAPAPQGATCNGPVIDYRFHGYDGVTQIVSCGTFGYAGGRLTVEAFDPTEDGLFRNGFEVAP